VARTGARRIRSSLIAGLDIGSTRTCAVIGELSGETGREPKLEVLGVGQARTSGRRGGLVANIDETTESIRQAMKEAELLAGATIDRLYVGISGEHIETYESPGVVAVSGDEVAPGDVQRVHEVARAVAFPPDRELIHAVPTDYVVDGQPGIKDPVGMAGTRLETQLFLVTGSAVAASNIRKAVSRAGYGVQELILEPLATSRAVLTEDEKEVGVAMVAIGSHTTGIAAYYEGKIRLISMLPVGGAALTHDLVRGLSLPHGEANRVKEGFALAMASMADPRETVEVPGPAPGQRRLVARELIAHVVEHRLEEILELAESQLGRAGLLHRLAAGIVLTGGTSAVPGIVELAQQVFAAPVRLGVPGEGLGGLADSVGRPRFACASGLALSGVDRWQQTGRGVSTRTSGVLTKVGAWLKEFF
jgi:cell division protein FtsA